MLYRPIALQTTEQSPLCPPMMSFKDQGQEECSTDPVRVSVIQHSTVHEVEGGQGHTTPTQQGLMVQVLGPDKGLTTLDQQMPMAAIEGRYRYEG